VLSRDCKSEGKSNAWIVGNTCDTAYGVGDTENPRLIGGRSSERTYRSFINDEEAGDSFVLVRTGLAGEITGEKNRVEAIGCTDGDGGSMSGVILPS